MWLQTDNFKRFSSVRAIIIGALCCLTVGQTVAQENKLPRIWERFDGTHCETTKAELDLIAQTAREGETIIIIAHLGNREYSRTVNRRRLQTLRDYLEYTRGLSKDRVIVAEGERVRGLGQVDIYVGGRLFTIFRVNRNKDLARGCSTA